MGYLQYLGKGKTVKVETRTRPRLYSHGYLLYANELATVPLLSCCHLSYPKHPRSLAINHVHSAYVNWYCTAN